MDNFHTQFYPNLIQNAENRAKFHLHSYIIMTPTSQCVMKLRIYHQNYVQVLQMIFHPNNSGSVKNAGKSLAFTSSTLSTEVIFTHIITVQHFLRKSYMEFLENMISRLVVDAVTVFFLKSSYNWFYYFAVSVFMLPL
jgi:hypothetical protein